ncbi:type II secretion system protein [Candidatus Daviesbacteria bacterium]|nr:type II secretion system protein [Candidatus Daviesbacteria bacterium]
MVKSFAWAVHKTKEKMQSRGFTLVELLVAIAIIAMVFGIVITSATGIRKSARDTQRHADLKSIQSALQQYYADQNYFPLSPLPSPGNALKNPVGTITYLQSIPKDPQSGDSYGYTSLKLDESVCDSSGINKCLKYCLFAKLENIATTSATQCQPIPSGFNYYVTQP